jgi:hypothetical protein
MDLVQPFVVDEKKAKVLGNAWGEELMPAAILEFVRQFMLRFPGRRVFAIREGPILTFAPEEIKDAGEFLRDFLALLTPYFQTPYGMQKPLDGAVYIVRVGRYKCEISLIDRVPHYHPDTEEFHYSDGTRYPYEIDNTPTIAVMPYDRPEFESTDDTDEISLFLPVVASRIGFAFEGDPRDRVLKLVPDRKRFHRFRRQIAIAYDRKDAGNRCRLKQRTLFDP